MNEEINYCVEDPVMCAEMFQGSSDYLTLTDYIEIFFFFGEFIARFIAVT